MVPRKSPSGQMSPGKSPTAQMSPGKSPQYGKLSHQMAMIKAKNPVLEPERGQMSPRKSPGMSPSVQLSPGKSPTGQISPQLLPGKSPSGQMLPQLLPGKSPSGQMSPGKSPHTSKLSPQRATIKAKNPFLEPIEEDESSENPQRLCRHYRYGNCTFGNSCRYVHADYDESGSQKERVSQVSVPKPSPSKAKQSISTKDPKKKGMYN